MFQFKKGSKVYVIFEEKIVKAVIDKVMPTGEKNEVGYYIQSPHLKYSTVVVPASRVFWFKYSAKKALKKGAL